MAMNRPEYRDAKTPRAVAVYTIAQESRHVVFKNIPALRGEETIIQDLLNRCSLYGTVEHWQQLDKQPRIQETFTISPILVTFSTINQARSAKRKMDDQVFYANLLQVYYAPEYDTIEDMRIKVKDRRTKVHTKLQYVPWDDIDDGNKKNAITRTNKRRQQQQQQRSTVIQDSESGLRQEQVPSAVSTEQQPQRSTVIQDSRLESTDYTASSQRKANPTPTLATKRRRI